MKGIGIHVDDYVKDKRDAFYGTTLAIEEAFRQKAAYIQFGPGEYHFSSFHSLKTRSIAHDDGCKDVEKKDCHILLRHFSHLTLCGTEEGKTLLTGYNDQTPQILLPSLIWAEHCKNLTVRNICFSRRPETAYSAIVEK